MAASIYPFPDGPVPVGPGLSPPVARLVRELTGVVPPGPADLSVSRRRYVESRQALAPATPDLALVRDEEIAGPGGPLRLRHYRAHPGWRPVPALLFLHGGGWTVGDLDSHDALCRQLAAATGHAIVSVDYRLAPEHPFPAALDDAWAALLWLQANAAALAIDPLAIGVAGDSAGGNLAAVLALRARDRGQPRLKAQVLIYPCVDLVAFHPSHRARAEGYLLTRDLYLSYVANYLGQGTSPLGWEVSPLRAADFAGLAPAVIVTAGFDPLLDEGKAYAGRLAEAGVPVIHRSYADMVHGFITMGGRLEAANQAVTDIAKALDSLDLYGLRDGAGI
ncbi:MAG TPA: alpha/beta hydrolase [Azospirillaceae bacterium]|nr:alpha/beta hydrolase [Azospirillaceae bacterium]